MLGKLVFGCSQLSFIFSFLLAGLHPLFLESHSELVASNYLDLGFCLFVCLLLQFKATAVETICGSASKQCF